MFPSHDRVEDIEELDKIQKSINDHLGELQKNATNSSIVVNNISSINKDDYDSVKRLINNLSKYEELYALNNEVALYTKKEHNLIINKLFDDNEYSKKLFIEVIKEYVEISEEELKVFVDQKSVKDFLETKINNNESVHKTVSSFTTAKINISDLTKSIKDAYVKKQIYGSKNIIELSNESKQEKINLRFDLYK